MSKNYQKIEADRYEQKWKAMRGQFTTKSRSYMSKVPLVALVRLEKYLKKKKLKKLQILDIGCGNGRNSVYLAKQGHIVNGIDVSPSAIKLANQNAKRNKLKINNKVGSVFNLPYKINSFDLLLDSGCLHHLRKSEWGNYLKNILRVLKPGGYLLLYCFGDKYVNVHGFRNRPAKRNWLTIKGHHYHFFTDKEIKEFFNKKFEIIYNYDEIKTNGKAFKVYLMKKKKYELQNRQSNI